MIIIKEENDDEDDDMENKLKSLEKITKERRKRILDNELKENKKIPGICNNHHTPIAIIITPIAIIITPNEIIIIPIAIIITP